MGGRGSPHAPVSPVNVCALCSTTGNVSNCSLSLLVHHNYGSQKHVCPIGSSLKALRILVTYKGQRDHVHLPLLRRLVINAKYNIKPGGEHGTADSAFTRLLEHSLRNPSKWQQCRDFKSSSEYSWFDIIVLKLLHVNPILSPRL